MADEAARLIGMKDGVVLEKTTEIDGKAAGFGKAADMPPAAVGEWADRIKEIFGLDYVIVYGDVQKEVRRVAISPGSGKGMLEQCMAVGAELFISGDIGHHDAIDSAAMGCAVIDAGHYGLEHIYMNYMKQYLEPLCEGVEFFTFEQGCPGVSR
jgi:putative NIF3 family GTP cyclohydrolase 1 type 2